MTAAHREAALRHFRRGNAFFEREKFSLALASYKEAVRLWDHPAIRYNMAICFIHQEDPVRAWESLERALRFGRGPLTVEKHRQALTYRRLLRGRLVSLTVACEEGGAEVTLDGLPLRLVQGRASLMVAPGARQLVASRAGHVTWKRVLALRAGEARRVEMRLISLEAALGTRRRWSQALPWSFAASGAAAAATGVALVLVARADAARFNERLEELCPSGCVRRDPLPGEDLARMPSSLVSLETRVKAEHYSAVALLGLGGAALVTGITLLLLNQPRSLVSRESAARSSPASPASTGSVASSGTPAFEVTPAVSPRGAHLALSLRF